MKTRPDRKKTDVIFRINGYKFTRIKCQNSCNKLPVPRCNRLFGLMLCCDTLYSEHHKIVTWSNQKDTCNNRLLEQCRALTQEVMNIAHSKQNGTCNDRLFGMSTASKMVRDAMIDCSE